MNTQEMRKWLRMVRTSSLAAGEYAKNLDAIADRLAELQAENERLKTRLSLADENERRLRGLLLEARAENIDAKISDIEQAKHVSQETMRLEFRVEEV